MPAHAGLMLKRALLSQRYIHTVPNPRRSPESIPPILDASAWLHHFSPRVISIRQLQRGRRDVTRTKPSLKVHLSPCSPRARFLAFASPPIAPAPLLLLLQLFALLLACPLDCLSSPLDPGRTLSCLLQRCMGRGVSELQPWPSRITTNTRSEASPSRTDLPPAASTSSCLQQQNRPSTLSLDSPSQRLDQIPRHSDRALLLPASLRRSSARQLQPGLPRGAYCLWPTPLSHQRQSPSSERPRSKTFAASCLARQKQRGGHRPGCQTASTRATSPPFSLSHPFVSFSGCRRHSCSL